VRHVPDGVLRRLVDEPLAVADADAGHVGGCHRCAERREQIAADAGVAGGLLSRPQPVPDIDDAWRRLQRSLADPNLPVQARRRPARRHWRLIVLPVPSAAVLTAVAVLVAGAAAATALTTVFAPTRVAPVKVSSADFQAIANVAGIDESDRLGGLGTPSGSMRLRFGSVRWSSAGRAYRATSMAAANRATGMNLRLPAKLPAGVGAPRLILVQPKVTATISFNAGAGAPLEGKSLRVTAGPAVLVEYGSSAARLRLPTLATFSMERPTASSGTTTAAQLEAFVLSRQGIPAGLAEEIRLIGGVGTTLPVPTPAGAHVSQVDVSGSPGVLVTAEAGPASGVIWEDRGGVVRAALGLLDEKDILGVADQLG
jgi:hypothetical protein